MERSRDEEETRKRQEGTLRGQVRKEMRERKCLAGGRENETEGKKETRERIGTRERRREKESEKESKWERERGKGRRKRGRGRDLHISWGQ